MKKIIFLLLLTLLSLSSFAEKINFSGHDTSIPIEWEEKSFGEKTSFEYNHKLARLAAYFSDAAYSHVPESPRENNLLDAYKKIGIKEADIEFHYEIDYTDALWGKDQCAFSISSKKIQSSRGLQTLIFVVLRGTPTNASEWISNLNVDDVDRIQKKSHIGFAKAASIVHTALISYMLRHSINPTDAFLFMTGHSRGAAVANMLSSILLEDNFFKPENIYAYTFACPNVTTAEDCCAEKYGFIWNIVNAEDIVPTVPMNRGKWAYKKFGHVLAFSNQTNTEESLYKNNYLPRINSIYQRLSGRTYYPFETGPFLPILVTKLVAYLTGDVEEYYDGKMDIHARAAKLMGRLFPEKDEEFDIEKPLPPEQKAPAEKKKGIGSFFLSWLDRKSNGLVNHMMLAAKDMHSASMYLSHMLALEENEIFSDLGYTLAIVKGYEELAVFDSEKNMLARVIEGKISYPDVKLPIAMCPSVGNRIVLGYPATKDFSVAITDEALIPSPVSVTIEYYDAAGVYLRSSEAKKIYPSINRLFQFKIGSSLLKEEASGLQVEYVDDGLDLIEKAVLRPRPKFDIVPEVNYGTNNSLGLGLHAGTSRLMASLMTRPERISFGHEGEIDFGLGNQQTLYSRFKAENEIFARFIWLDQEDRSFNLLPEYRTSVSMKLIGRLRFFVAGTFDFCISDFNDEAFGQNGWVKTRLSWDLNDSLSIVPGLQAGLRF